MANSYRLKVTYQQSAAGILLLLVAGLLLQGEPFRCRFQLLLFLQYLGHQLVEGHGGAVEGFGAGFDIDNADFLCDFGCLLLVDFAQFLEVVFVAHQQEVDAAHVGLLADLFDPEVDHFEGLAVADVEHQEDAVHVAVVVGGDGIISGSSCGVPDLHADGASVFQFEGLLFVLDADGGGVVGAELLVHVLDQQRALAHVALPDYQQFHPHLIFASAHRLYQTTLTSSLPSLRWRWGESSLGWRGKCCGGCRCIIGMLTGERPKKPLNHYFKFRQQRMKEHEGKPNRIAIIKREWNKLSEEEKNRGYEIFVKEFQRWKREIEKWDARNQKGEEDVREIERSNPKPIKVKDEEKDEAVKPPKQDKAKGAPPKGKSKEQEKAPEKVAEKSNEKVKTTNKVIKEDKEDEDQNAKKEPIKGKRGNRK